MKTLGVSSRRVTEGLYVAGHQEIEWFDLVEIFFPFVELRKRPDEDPAQIPFDAAANDGRAEHSTEKESGTAEVNPPATWGGLETRSGWILSVVGIITNRVIVSMADQPLRTLKHFRRFTTA